MSGKGTRAVQNDHGRYESPAHSGVAHYPLRIR
jgi:hypothetical protein